MSGAIYKDNVPVDLNYQDGQNFQVRGYMVLREEGGTLDVFAPIRGYVISADFEILKAACHCPLDNKVEVVRDDSLCITFHFNDSNPPVGTHAPVVVERRTL